MNLRDKLNQYYFDATVCELRMLSRSGGGDLSYNSVMYLDIIAFQAQDGGCTVGRLARTLNISPSAVTSKVGELVKQGLVRKIRSETDRRVIDLQITDQVAQVLNAYDSPFQRAVQQVEAEFSPEELRCFCSILDTFIQEYQKGC